MEQPVGEYTQRDRPAKPAENDEPEPSSPRGNVDAGMPATRPIDASTGSGSGPDSADPTPADAGSGVPTGPSTWLPPMLIDGGPSQTGCGVNYDVAERRRLDMYLMVDSNVTVSATGVWEVMTDGISRFVNDPRSKGTGVGIRYFGNTCVATDYDTPDVEIDLLPKNANAIVTSTRARRWSASPMLYALEGALIHQKDRAQKYPQVKQVVALVSDGFSQDLTCIYSTQALADSAQGGFMVPPSVETHVIAVGVNTTVSQPLDDLIERLGAFNAIADAGGSGQAVTTSITGNSAEFADALQRVRRNALPCEYEAPTGAALGTFGVTRIPLADQLPYFANENACGSKQGWYFAAESQPTPVTMCPATCEWLREADDHQIGLLRGCME